MDEIKVFIDDEINYAAGKFVFDQAKARIWGKKEVAFMMAYLSQDPKGRFNLPEEKVLLKKQAENKLCKELGDISQGAHPVYYREAETKVSRMVYEASDGCYMCAENVLYQSGEIILEIIDAQNSP